MATSTATKTILWPGASGTEYKYWIYPIGCKLAAKPGNYIFAKEVSPGRYIPIYTGETGNLSERFDGHHKAGCINSQGATHIHAHLNNGGQNARRAEEGDIVHKWSPTCNG